jgi:predicted Holliday junction resolvase-like endonuclease
MLDQSPALFILGTLLAAAVLVIVLLWRRYENLLQQHDDIVHGARKDSVDRSRSTLKGQIAEQMAPLLPGFPYMPADARFLGDPIDYIVFTGYTETQSATPSGDDLEIVLLEIKHGQAKLSPIQRAIAKAVEEGRFRFEVSRVGEDGTVTTNAWRSNRNRMPAPSI